MDEEFLEQLQTSIFSQREKIIIRLKIYHDATREDAEDAYQEAIADLWDKIHSGELTTNTINTSLYAYFRKMCVNKYYSMKRQSSDAHSRSELFSDQERFEHLVETNDAVLSENQCRMLHRTVMGLGKPCTSIIWKSYADKLSGAEIAKEIGFANADSVKSKKSGCIKDLKKILSGKLKKEFYD